MPSAERDHLRVVEGGRDREPQPITSDVALEDNVVGNAVYQGDLVADLRVILEPKHLESRAARTTYEAVLRLHDRGQPVDGVAVLHELNLTGKLPEIGGPQWLHELQDRMPVLIPRHVLEHARRVRDLYVRRRWRDACRFEVGRAQFDGAPIAEILDGARRGLDALVGELTAGETSGHVDVIADKVAAELLGEGSRGEGVVPTGFGSLDRHVHGLPIDLAVLAGLPGDGKTSLATAIAVHVARAGGGVVINSLETTREELLLRMAAAEARVNMARTVAGKLGPGELTRLLDGMQALRGLPLYLEERVYTVRELWARARTVQLGLHARGKRLRLVVVDYLQLMKPARERDEDHKNIAKVTRDLKDFATEIGAAVLAISQVKEDQVLARKGGRVTMADLFGSSELRKCPRLVLGVYHPDARDQGDGYQRTGVVELDVLKNNKGARGGTAELLFDGPSASFRDGAPVGAERAPVSYTCGGCGRRVEQGVSCSCGATRTPPAAAPEDWSIFPAGYEPR